MSKLLLEIQRVFDSEVDCPSDDRFQSIAEQAWSGEPAELCLRLVDSAEMQELNLAFRGKDSATNVLAFPAEMGDFQLPPDQIAPAGDIVICAPVVQKEALEQGKKPLDHWAHLWVHGLLHLQGHDHIEDDEANRMEECERQILAKLRIPDPYAADNAA